MRPPQTLTLRNQTALGPYLKQATGGSRKRFVEALGAFWPLFTLVRAKLGEDLAYEIMSYVALDRDYANALIEVGYHETVAFLKRRTHNEFQKNEHSSPVRDKALRA